MRIPNKRSLLNSSINVHHNFGSFYFLPFNDMYIIIEHKMSVNYKKRVYQRGPYALTKIQISLQKVISEGIWPLKAVVFAFVTKRDFATIPSQINNLRGQSTVATEQIRLHKYITKYISRRLIFSERKQSSLTTIVRTFIPSQLVICKFQIDEILLVTNNSIAKIYL